MSFYQKSIHRIDRTVNPAGVEGSMRLQYGTLDHLPHETFVEEVQIAKACEAADPSYLKGVAESYGMAKDYENWESKMKQDQPGPATEPPSQ